MFRASARRAAAAVHINAKGEPFTGSQHAVLEHVHREHGFTSLRWVTAAHVDARGQAKPGQSPAATLRTSSRADVKFYNVDQLFPEHTSSSSRS